MRSRADGTWETKGSIDAKSTMRSVWTLRADLVSQHAAEERTTTGVHADDFPASVDLGDLDLVGDDDATAHEVDEVAGQEVLGEQHLSRTALELRRSTRRPSNVMRPAASPPIFLDGHEEVATLDADHRADDRRVRVVAEPRDQVLDASNLVAVRVVDRAAQERREVENFSHGQPSHLRLPRYIASDSLGRISVTTE